MSLIHALSHALKIAGSMTWQITWSLILGFTLSAIIEALVKKSTIARLLPNDRFRSLATATGLGAASSSCSYAAVALSRSLYRKGADFTAAMTFQFASTNLVIELGLILALLLGWRFTLAEFVGGPFMILLLALIFRRFLTNRLREQARAQANKGLAGSMEGHASMDMSVTVTGSFWQRLTSRECITSVSHNFVMEWAAILRDLVLGRDTELTRLPWVGRHVRRWEPEPLRWLGVRGLYAAYRVADRQENGGRGSTSPIARLADRISGR